MAAITLPERRHVMEVIVGAIVSMLGHYLYGMDFCTLYTFISIGIATYKAIDHTNDKTALQ